MTNIAGVNKNWVAHAMLGVCLGAILPVAKAQSAAGGDQLETRIARIERGIEPVVTSPDEPPIALDLARLMQIYNDPGLSIAVIDNFKLAFVKGYGVSEPNGKSPVTPKTLFQAGSISKPVTATGMLALVEQGKLSLDEDVNLILKTWKVPENEFTKEQKVTLRRIASHTAGLTVHGFPGYDVDDKLPTLVQILNGEKPANTPPIRVDFVPGSQERYSGGGVTIEQLVMMDVSGKPFPELMKQIVLDKIGMMDSSFDQPLPGTWAARTAGGARADGKEIHGKWHIYPEMAAAGLWTTPTDLANFAIEIALSKQGKSNKVLSQKITQQMLTPQPPTAGTGIGFAVPPNHPGEFGHNGADEGFQALLVMNADTGQGAVIMANSDNGVLVGSDLLLSVAKEYRWKYLPDGRSDGDQIVLIDDLKGVDAALRKFDDLNSNGDPKKRPQEFILNLLGYKYLQAGNTDEAIKIFQKNVLAFPNSSNVYDSLGEAYADAGKKDLAIQNYENSVKLDPNNQNGKDWLKKLKGEK